MVPDAHNAAWDAHVRQAPAVCESMVSNARNAVGDAHAPQLAAVIEGRGFNAPNAVRDGVTMDTASGKTQQYCEVLGEKCAVLACVDRTAWIDYNVHQAPAGIEGIVPNTYNASWDSDARQAAAAKCCDANACNAVREAHTRQARAVCESIVSDAPNAVWDTHIRQAAVLVARPCSKSHLNGCFFLSS